MEKGNDKGEGTDQKEGSMKARMEVGSRKKGWMDG